MAVVKQGRGRSSGVERNLAKVEVVSSNLIARSNAPLITTAYGQCALPPGLRIALGYVQLQSSNTNGN